MSPMSDDYNVYEDGKGIRRTVLKGGRVVCDFCLAPNPGWTYPAGFTAIYGHHLIDVSDDEWGACDDCHVLIEAVNIEGLVERMAEMQPVHSPPDKQHVYPPLAVRRRISRQNVIAFFKARSGPAEHDSYPPK